MDYLRTHFGAPTDRTHRIYNGLDLSAFPYHPPINRPSHVVAVGRLVEKKGFPFLIEAIGLLRDRGISCAAARSGISAMGVPSIRICPSCMRWTR